MTQDAYIPPRGELDAWIEAYEQFQAQNGDADLAAFLPAPDHVLYQMALRELVRVDLEYGWQQGRPHPLEDYRKRFPELFADVESLEAVAFEEYRLRLQAGERPTPVEYQHRYGVCTEHWLDHWAEVHDFAETHVLAPNAELEVLRAYQRYLLEGTDHDVTELESARRHAEETSCLPSVGSEFLGFRLMGELGRGAFGRVYLARQGELADRTVALKISADPAQESHTLAQLNHDNIVPIYSVHREPPFQAVCMPFLGATTLADFLGHLRSCEQLPTSGASLVLMLERGRQRLAAVVGGLEPRGSDSKPVMPSSSGPPDGPPATLKALERMSYVRAVLWLGARLASGLQHAHECGILHRDLKPANILLTDHGQPMLLDFNLSHDTKLGSSVSAAFVGGTLLYMAPEHLAAFRGHGQCLDRRSDLYSLGVILHELLTGRHPFPIHRGPLRQVLAKMIRDREQPAPSLRAENSELPRSLEAIIRHCLEPNPEFRYSSAADLQEDLECQLNDLPLRHALEPSGLERGQKWLRRQARWLTLGRMTAATFTLCLVGALGILGQEYRRLYLVTNQGERIAQRPAAPVVDAPAQEAAFYLEQCRLCLGRADTAAAVAAADSALALAPGWAAAHSARARAYQARGDLDRALGDLLAASAPGAGDPDLEAARNDPHFAGAFLRQGIACKEQGQYEQAIAHCSDALQLDPTCSSAYLHRAESYWRLQQWERAREDCKQVLARDSGCVPAYTMRGDAHRRLYDDEDARADYESALRLDSTCWRAWRGRTELALERDSRRSLLELHVRVFLEPANPYLLAERGRALLATGRPQAAVEDCNQALQRSPDCATALQVRARAQLALGRLDAAAADASQALRLAPTDESTYLVRARARFARGGNYPATLADCSEAVRLAPRSGEARELRGRVHEVTGAYAAAREDAMQARRLTVRPATIRPASTSARMGPGKTTEIRAAVESPDSTSNHR